MVEEIKVYVQDSDTIRSLPSCTVDFYEDENPVNHYRCETGITGEAGIIYNVKTGRYRVLALYPGYVEDKEIYVTVSEKTKEIIIQLKKETRSIPVLVKDSETQELLPNIIVDFYNVENVPENHYRIETGENAEAGIIINPNNGRYKVICIEPHYVYDDERYIEITDETESIIIELEKEEE